MNSLVFGVGFVLNPPQGVQITRLTAEGISRLMPTGRNKYEL